MYEIAFKDFRGFHHANFVEIRPITILIGENSAGKSSFLAGLKYAIDFLGSENEASFNKDPFQLGTFQQIAHYRGGRAGRAREFKIRLRANVRRPRRPTENEMPVTFDITFANIDSQASPQSVEITLGSETLSAKLENDRVNVVYSARPGESYPLANSDSFPRVVRTEFARYWPFVLRELRLRIQRLADDGQTTLLNPDVETRAAAMGEYADAFARTLRAPIEATSAIRTKPLRTYTPGTETRDGEGSHVPYEMAKLYRDRNKDAWKSIKDSLERFGERSEMFREVNIKSFGQSASDPFQIQFSTDGPKTNLVDLGYGTSQVLPILYDVASAPRHTRFLIQQPEVHLHPKAQAALGTFFVDTYLRETKEFVLETHSDFIVDRVREAVSKRKLRPDDVSVLFFERKNLENTITPIELDTEGIPIDPPSTYRSFFIDEEMRALGL